MYLSSDDKWIVFVDWDPPYILENDKGDPMIFMNEDDAEAVAREMGCTAFTMKYSDYLENTEF